MPILSPGSSFLVLGSRFWFWVLRSGFYVPGSTFRVLRSGFWCLRLHDRAAPRCRPPRRRPGSRPAATSRTTACTPSSHVVVSTSPSRTADGGVERVLSRRTGPASGRIGRERRRGACDSVSVGRGSLAEGSVRDLRG